MQFLYVCIYCQTLAKDIQELLKRITGNLIPSPSLSLCDYGLSPDDQNRFPRLEDDSSHTRNVMCPIGNHGLRFTHSLYAYSGSGVPLWEAKHSKFADPKIIVSKSVLRMWISRASLASNFLVLGPHSFFWRTIV